MPTSPAEDVTGADETRPIPPRYVWLRWFSIVGGVVLVVGIGVHVWWAHLAESRFQGAIAAYRAAGQPVLIEDFAVEPVRDVENAALPLRQAVAAVVTRKGAVDLRDWQSLPQIAREHPQELQDLLAANESALADFREGCARPRANWGVVLKSPIINILLPDLSGQRQLAYLTSVAAAERHLAGDDAAALTLVRDKEAHVRHLADYEPCLITYFVCVAMESSTVRTIELITPDLRISGGGAQVPAGIVPADRKDVEALVATLLDDEPWHARWRQAIYGERLMQIDSVQCLIDGTLPGWASAGGMPALPGLYGRIAATLLGPAWKLDAVRVITSYTQVAEAGSAPNWPAGQALLPPPPDTGPSSPWKTAVYFMSQVLAATMEQTPRNQYRILAEQRMAATALAMRLYELDHGHRPATLAELVPDYLPAVPRDPFAADDRPLGYLPDAASPVLYSVSLNGEDDGGQYTLWADSGVDWRGLDLPFFLNGDRPLPRSRSMPAPGTSQPASMQGVPVNEAVDELGAEADETDEAQPEP
ncbi:MAG: hypothetical protein PVJ57_11770 [Phycisphaerae bacterium]